MTGMTDISRHGGDSKHYRDDATSRGGRGIQVKDDALIDPELLGVTSEYQIQTEPLVDDSDDDGNYEFGDSGPGMATKVVQTGFKLLFFPLILVYRGITSLRHIPWLCGQILAGVKNVPATLKRFGTVFLSLFSPKGRLGKMLFFIGNVTGVIWFVRRFQTPDTGLRVSEQTENPEAKAQVQNLKSEVRSLEHDESKSRRRIGFGQLSKLASAFKRSEPAASPDAVSPNSEDRYDSFETSGNHWGTRKSMLFAASCLALLIGCVTVAWQVMHNNKDVAKKDVENNDTGQKALVDDTVPTAGVREPEQKFSGFGGYPGIPGTMTSAQPNAFPAAPAPVPDYGIPSYDVIGQSTRGNTSFSEQETSIPAMNNGVGNETPSGFPGYLASNNQGGSIEIGIMGDDPEEPIIGDRQSIVTDMQRPFDADATGYDNNNGFDYNTATAMTRNGQTPLSPFAAAELPTPVAPAQGYSGYSGGLPDSLNAMSVTRPQTTLVTATPTEPYALTGTSQSSPASLQPDQSLIVLSSNQTEISRIPNNDTLGNRVSSDTGLSASPETGTGIMALTQMNSANTMSEINEQNAWTAIPPESPMMQPTSQPTSQPMLQSGTGIEIVQNESQYELPGQTPYNNRNPEPVFTPSLSSVSGSFMDFDAPEIPAAFPLVPSLNMIASVPQVQTQTQPVNPQPVLANVTNIVAPPAFPDTVQDSIGGIASHDMIANSIVSPSQHIAAMPMISSDTQTGYISLDMPSTVVNATSAPAYSPQHDAPPATVAQFAPNGQNDTPVLRQNSIYIVQPGDSIYKIAKQELGSVRRYREIYELNRDRLPIGQDTLTAGIELLLPTGQ